MATVTPIRPPQVELDQDGRIVRAWMPSSNEHLMYAMHVLGTRATCSCRGYESHGHCKHQEALERFLEEDKVTTETGIVKHEAAPAPIVVHDTPTALLPTRDDLERMAFLAGQAVKAVGVIPTNIKTKEQALAVMIAGWELGLRPMTALRHVYVVNGKTEIETRAMVGIIKARRPDIAFSWPEYTQDAVTCVIERPGQPVTRVRYSREDATASGQIAKGGPWKAYTRDMLYAAATKRACRLACPDLINAIETGLQHTVAEAESYGLPDTNVRVLDESPDIPQSAYNDGDEPEPPVVEPDKTGYLKAQQYLQEARETWDTPSHRRLLEAVNERFPGCLNVRGDLMMKPAVREQGDAIWEYLSREPDEAVVQGELVP